MPDSMPVGADVHRVVRKRRAGRLAILARVRVDCDGIRSIDGLGWLKKIGRFVGHVAARYCAVWCIMRLFLNSASFYSAGFFLGCFEGVDHLFWC